MFLLRFRLLLPVVTLLCSGIFAHAASVTDQIKWAPGTVPAGQINGPDTLDDIWQGKFNAWALDPLADEDKDGCSNFVECVAATNPFVAGDCFQIGDMTLTDTSVIFLVKVEAGKKYRVLSADSPAPISWTPETLQTPVQASVYIPSADQAQASISVARPAGDQRFYRLETSDVDANGDGLSDWAARELGLVPTLADSDGNGVSDVTEITQEMQSPDVVTVVVDNAFTSEDGGSPGMLRLRRSRSLLGASVSYKIDGTAIASDYYEFLSGQAQFAVGEKEVFIGVTPVLDAVVEGSESVTVTLTGGVAGSGAAQAFSAPLQIGNSDDGSVLIANSTTAAGTGLLARYYDHSNGTYAHAANYGDAANYTYTRNGAGPIYTGTIVVAPTGVSAGRLTTLLNAVSVGSQVKLSFNGGNLNAAAYNNQLYTVSAKTSTNFTCTASASASLPASSNSTCNFSIQPLHPAVIERVDAVVNNDWIYGTANGVGVTAAATAGAIPNSPDNYSTTYETYLHPATAGSYRFQLDADDKARVLLDLNNSGTFELPGEQILEHGWDTAATVGTFKISSSYPLTVPASASQRLKMRVEHVETTGDARCRLQWSRDGGNFGNIAQAEQFTHTQAITYAFTRGTPVTTGTATISLTGHGLSVGNTVTLAFTNGTLFTPNAIDLNGYSGTYTVATVPDANSFTVTLNSTGSTLPANQGSGATGFLENRTVSTTTGVYNKIYNTTTFTQAPGRIGVDSAVTTGNNGLWGSGTPDAALINPDTFSIRWTGQVQPQFTEEYTFIVNADDGCALRINGQQMDLKAVPSTNSDGSTYVYDNASGNAVVNYMNARVKAGSFVVGETVRLDPSSGNLNHPNGSTYTYDAVTGVATVNYSNLTTVLASGFKAGQIVELDPTSGTANALANARYTILASPAPTSNTFAVSFGINAFASETAGTATINITDNRDAVITAVHAAGTGTYSYTSANGNAVVDYSALGIPANTIQVGHVLALDPNSGNLNGLPNAFATVTAATATTFTVNYGTGFTTGTGNIVIVAPSSAGVPVGATTAFTVNFEAAKYANNSTGNINLEIVNKPLKDWSSLGNERFVRLPVVGGMRYDIDLEYYENGSYARCILYWMSPSQPKQVIPVERLYPESVPQAPPAHVAETSATALVGGAFNYAVLRSNGGTVSVSGLPPGLSLVDGVISGTATTAGDHQVLITLSNADGTSTSALNLHVEDAGGSVTREVWTGIGGTTIGSIPLTTTANSTAALTSLQTPTNAADNIGVRVRGYITAPKTGNYYFWLAASDSAEFWLSNDDEPIN
ncbi:MAG: PA14 domain-containing protein, partial [Roseimicrobium sp.]